jgi:chaperonin GroEL (HSP60 family)
MNIARTTLSSKILSQNKEYFAKLAVDAVVRLKGSGDLSAIQIIKKKGGCMEDSFLDDGALFPQLSVLWSNKSLQVSFWTRNLVCISPSVSKRHAS